MKFKHSLKNYLLAPFILAVNPVVYFLSFIAKNISRFLLCVIDILPKFDIDWTKENEQNMKRVQKEYFKLVQKEKNGVQD